MAAEVRIVMDLSHDGIEENFTRVKQSILYCSLTAIKNCRTEIIVIIALLAVLQAYGQIDWQLIFVMFGFAIFQTLTSTVLVTFPEDGIYVEKKTWIKWFCVRPKRIVTWNQINTWQRTSILGRPALQIITTGGLFVVCPAGNRHYAEDIVARAQSVLRSRYSASLF